jgi:hypothetical protein
MPYYGSVTAAYVEYVSLDTEVFVASAFGFKGRSFEALKKHLVEQRLNLVMTDIAVNEVKSRIEKSVTAELVFQLTYVNKAKALFNSSLEEVQTGLKKLDPKVVAKDLCDRFDAFLTETKATIIDANDIAAGDVIGKYFSGQPPFGPGEKKRFEFPDAFAIQTLAEWAETHDLHMLVVSGDKLFQKACEAYSHLIPKSSINEVLDHVASDNEQLAAFVRAQTIQRMPAILGLAKSAFEDRYYWVEGENGDAQVEVTNQTPANEVEIIEIVAEKATLQLNIAIDYTAHLSYDDSATASYDEGDLVYVDHKEEDVERDVELTVEIEVFFEKMDPTTFEILYVSVTSPSDGFGIETALDDGWPYK